MGADQNCAPYDFGLPSDEMAAPPHPPDACVTPERVALGRQLFYDRRLSRHVNQSCADCHVQARGFTDGRVASMGSTGQVHARNALGLADVGYFATLTRFNPELTRFDSQALVSLFSENTKTTIEEMAISSKEWVATDRLVADPEYPALFAAAYPEAGIDPAAPRKSQGLHLITKRPEYRGKFRTPSLRNVAVTGPCMHDGSVPTLAAGARAFALTAGETRDLLAFLESFTDDCFLSDPAADPAPELPAHCRS